MEKNGMGKLYEKYCIIKRNAHTLDVAIAHDKLTGRNEIILVNYEHLDDGSTKVIPLAKLLPSEALENELEPMFDRSMVISALFQTYAENDEDRFSVTDFDNKTHPVDEDYSTMLEMYLDVTNAMDKLDLETKMENAVDDIVNDFRKILDDETGKEKGED